MTEFYTEEKLINILELMKNRREIDHPVNYDAIRETSTYLLDGLLLKLLKFIASTLDTVNSLKLLESNELPNDQASTDKIEKLNWNLVKLSAEVIFFALYQTQVEVEEAKLLLEVIHSLSDSLAKSVDDFSSSGSIPTGNANNLFNLRNQMVTSLFYVLIVLQLSHVCAHQQIAKLLSRRKNYYNKKSFEIEPGNLLPQKRGSKYGLEKQAWKCSGAKGFANLVFAVFRQPEVDEGKAPKEDVEWFMHEACVLRAYNYIRLIILPFIQTSSVIRYEYSLFFVAVIAELLENITKLFVFSHYEHHENDFPYIFFPPTMDFYIQNIHFYHSILEEYSHTRASPFKRTPQQHLNNSSMNMSMMSDGGATSLNNSIYEVDTLQDVMNLYIDLLHYYPSFATIFWGELKEDDENNLDDLHQSNHYLHDFHPFIVKVFESAQHHRHLTLDTMRLLTALANGPKGCTVKSVYHLIARGDLNKMDWHVLFEKINRFTNEFITVDENMNRLGGNNNLPGGNEQGLYPNQGQQAQFRQRQLSAIDLEGILVIVELIGAVVAKASIAQEFVNNFQMLIKLFNLLSCPIPIEIKGSILNTIGTIALHSCFTAEIWELLDSSGLFSGIIQPLTLTINTIENRLSLSYRSSLFFTSYSRGIKAELEENESRCGRYPVTNGFLILIRNLLSHGLEIPNNLGGPLTSIDSNNTTATNDNNTLPRRIPGIIPYIEYIIEDILLKSHERFYSPDSNLNILTQKWRITCRCLEIFNIILQNYPIHQYNLSLLTTQFNKSYEEMRSTIIQQDSLLSDFFEEFTYYSLPTATTIGGAATTTNPTNLNALVAFNANKTMETSQNRYRRPKTIGFHLLGLCLNNTKLMEFLLKTLQVLNYSYLMQSSKYYTTTELLLLQDIYKFGFVNLKLRSKLSFLFYEKDHFTNYIKSLPQHQPFYQHLHGVVVGGDGNNYDYNHPNAPGGHFYHLSNAKKDSLSTNSISWIERTLAMTVNLLYEISLREYSFRYLFKLASQGYTNQQFTPNNNPAMNMNHMNNNHSTTVNPFPAGNPLYLTKYNYKKGSSSHLQQIPLHPYPLSDILTHGNIPNILLSLISIEFITLPILPVLNVIITKLIEFLLLQKPFHLFSISDHPMIFFEMGRADNENNNNRSTFHGLPQQQQQQQQQPQPQQTQQMKISEQKQILENFIYCLLAEKEFPPFLYEEDSLQNIFYNIFYQGYDQKPFTSLNLLTHLPTSNALTNANAASSSSSSGVTCYGSVREAVVTMILTTLMNHSNTFAHFLLGFHRNNSRYSSTSSSIFMNFNGPSTQLITFDGPSSTGKPNETQNSTNNNNQSSSHQHIHDCFDALLELISPNHNKITHFFLKFPKNCLIIYELIYYLSFYSTTSFQLFERLLKNSFLLEHLQYFYFLMKLSQEEMVSLLLELDLLIISNDKDERNQQIFTKLLDYQIYINHAMSYLLKIFGNELSLLFSSALASSPASTAATASSSSSALASSNYLLLSNHHYAHVKSIISLLFHQYFLLGGSSSTSSSWMNSTTAASSSSTMKEEQLGIIQILYYAFQEDSMNALMKEVILANRIFEEVVIGENPAEPKVIDRNIPPEVEGIEGIEYLTAHKLFPAILSCMKESLFFESSSLKGSMKLDSSAASCTGGMNGSSGNNYPSNSPFNWPFTNNNQGNSSSSSKQQRNVNLSSSIHYLYSSNPSNEKESIASPAYKVIDIPCLLKKLKDLFQPVTMSATNNNTAAAVAGTNEIIQEALREMEYLIRLTIQLSILFNQQEKLNASRNHVMIAMKYVIECVFICMMSPMTSMNNQGTNNNNNNNNTNNNVGQDNQNNPANPGTTTMNSVKDSSLMTKIFSEIQEISSLEAIQKFIFLEFLFPLIRFMKVHYYEISNSSMSIGGGGESSMKETVLKSIIVLLKFSQSMTSSSSSSLIHLKEDEIRLFSFTMKEITEIFLFLLTNSTTILNYQFIKQYSLQDMIRMKLFSFSSPVNNNNNASNNNSSGNNDSNFQSMSFRGYLGVALHLTMNLFAPSTALPSSMEENSSVPQSEEKEERTQQLRKQSYRSLLLIQRQVFHSLKQNIQAVAELLMFASLEGPILFRINALTTLNKFLSQLTVTDHSTHSDSLDEFELPPSILAGTSSTSSSSSSRLIFKLFQYFLQKNYFLALLQKILPSSSSSSTASMGLLLSSKEEIQLFQATIHFFHSILLQVGDVSYVMNAWMEIGFIESFCFAPFLMQLLQGLFFQNNQTNRFSSTTNTGSSSSKGSSSMIEGSFVTAKEVFSFFTILLSFSSSSASSSSSSSSFGLDKEILKTFLLFYQQIRELLTTFFHQSIQYYLQLELLEQISSFLFLLCNQLLLLAGTSSSSLTSSPSEKYSSNYSKLFQFLGQDMEILLMDCLHLLQFFGTKPIPSSLIRFYVSPSSSSHLHRSGPPHHHQAHQQAHHQPAMNQEMSRLIRSYFENTLEEAANGMPSSSGWWENMQPTTNISADRMRQELSWQSQRLSSTLPSSSLMMPMQWTVYDELKLERSLEILFQIVSLLRLFSLPDQKLAKPSAGGHRAGSSSPSAMQSHGHQNLALKLFPVPLLIHLFVECSMLFMQLQLLSNNSNQAGNHNLPALPAPPVSADGFKNPTATTIPAVHQTTAQSTSNAPRPAGSPFIILQGKTLSIAENLAIILYHLVLSGQAGSSLSSSSSLLSGNGRGMSEEEAWWKQFFQVADLFPMHSFVSVVIRWIQEEIRQ